MLTRRRMMMQEAEAGEHWDYIFTKSSDGYYHAVAVPVTVGQVVTIEFAPSTNTNGYIYYSQGSPVSPTSQRASSATLKAGGTIEKEVVKDGTMYFGTSNTSSTYYNFNGDYIKVRIT